MDCIEINKAKNEVKEPPQERAVDVEVVKDAGSELVRFQSQISNWTGPDLSMASSQLIHSSKATLISLTDNISSKQGQKRVDSLFMYLFDNQLVLCSNGYFKRFSFIQEILDYRTVRI